MATETPSEITVCGHCGQSYPYRRETRGCDACGRDDVTVAYRLEPVQDDPNVVVIGPECFAMLGGSVLNWRGENYVPQSSPQGEDHEAEIPEAALDAAEQAVHACRHYALGHPSRRALYVDARDEAYDVLAAALPHLAARSPQDEGHKGER